jgi:predicted amidohydrolase
MKIALCAANMEKPVSGLDDFLSRITDIVKSQKGADIIVFPEYFTMKLLDFAPKGLKIIEEIPCISSLVTKNSSHVSKLSSEENVAILFGTMPVSKGGEYRNRAVIFFPDGTKEFQDKLHLTPSEKQRDGWFLNAGDKLNSFEFGGKEFGIMICHDTTSADMAFNLKDKGVDIILVPSMTETETGIDSHSYIFDHAKEISEKFSLKVLVVGAIGSQHLANRTETNVGGAAFYENGKIIKSTPAKSSLGSKDALTLMVEI